MWKKTTFQDLISPRSHFIPLLSWLMKNMLMKEKCKLQLDPV